MEWNYIVAGPEFGQLEGHYLIIVKALYGLRVGRSDTNEGRTLKESHTYEKHPT
jgi:hypothetical protein